MGGEKFYAKKRRSRRDHELPEESEDHDHRWNVHVDLASDSRNLVRAILGSSDFWRLTLLLSVIFILPYLVIMGINAIPESLSGLKVLGTLMILCLSGLAAGLREAHKLKEDPRDTEWVVGQEKRKKPFEEEGIY